MQNTATLITSPLAFSLKNDQQKPVIYITNDPSLNQLTFTLANTGGVSLPLRGGTPVAEPDRQSGSPTTLYLTLGSLLTVAEFQAAQFEAAGWQATYFTKAGVTNWGLTPVNDLSLGAGETISFSLRKLTATERPGSGFLTVDYYGLGSIPDSAYQQKTFLQNPPITGRKELAIGTGFSGSNEVFVSRDALNPVRNKLSFYLANPDPTAPIVPPDVPWETNAPVFILSFVVGKPPGYGALTTAEDAVGITVGQKSTTGTLWNVEPVPATDNPTWRLLPQNHEVLGFGAESTVDFEIANIISQFEPGLTSMYLQYANIPGYNDGFVSRMIQKEVPVLIDSFYADPSFVVKGPDSIKVVLHWKAENATSLEISSSQFGRINVSGKSHWAVPEPLKSTMVFTLHATGENNTFLDQTIKVEVIEFQVNLKPVSGLTGEIVYFNLAAYSRKGTFAYFLNANGLFAAVNTRTNVAVMHQFKVKYAANLVASPEIDPTFDRLYFCDVNAYEIIVVNIDGSGNATVVKRVKTPQYSLGSMVVSPDGKRLFYNNGDIGMLSIADYEQKNLGVMQIPGSDYRSMAISPEGNSVYLNLATGAMVVQFDVPSQKTVARLDVGKVDFNELKISPDGKQLYLIQGDKIMVLLTEEKLRAAFIPIGERPFTLAVAPNRTLVYAFVQDTRTLVVIDTINKKVLKNIPLEGLTGSGGDVAIAVSPDGQRLYVTDAAMYYPIVEVKVITT